MPEGPTDRPKPAFPGLGRYAGMGVELAGAVIGLTLLGVWIDYRYETGPVGTLVGAGLGVVGGTYNLIRQALRLMAAEREATRKRADEARDRNQPRDESAG